MTLSSSFNPLGGGPLCIRLENRAGAIEWLSIAEAIELAEELDSAIYAAETKKWDDAFDTTADAQ